jgi:hypothetical protein
MKFFYSYRNIFFIIYEMLLILLLAYSIHIRIMLKGKNYWFDKLEENKIDE